MALQSPMNFLFTQIHTHTLSLSRALISVITICLFALWSLTIMNNFSWSASRCRTNTSVHLAFRVSFDVWTIFLLLLYSSIIIIVFVCFELISCCASPLSLYMNTRCRHKLCLCVRFQIDRCFFRLSLLYADKQRYTQTYTHIKDLKKSKRINDYIIIFMHKNETNRPKCPRRLIFYLYFNRDCNLLHSICSSQLRMRSWAFGTTLQ